jgi:hypothetical protein
VCLLVAVFALAWVPLMAFGLHTLVPLVSLVVSLGFGVLAALPCKALGEKPTGGDVVLATEGSAIGLCQPALA